VLEYTEQHVPHRDVLGHGNAQDPLRQPLYAQGGNAVSGAPAIKWDGARPTPDYSPKKLQGAIILGTAGDGSSGATGTFYEGAITIGNPADSVDNAVRANVVAAGYGR
jgi:hypothetical protein